MLASKKKLQNDRRRTRQRRKLLGTSERPRLNVTRSHLNLYVQAINDFDERTLCTSSTLTADLRNKKRKQWGNVEAAKEFGSYVAEALKKKKISRIVFDRGGRPFQGRLRAFAEALRENGIQF
jgi:large subunit ribosomal protein L18